MKKIVFLDRDGVINRYPGDREYVSSLSKFRMLPGVAVAIKRIKDAGFKVFVISNQAGVSKGIYSRSTLDKITSRMLSALKKHKTGLDGVYYCIHTDDHRCSCRKPHAGLIYKAISEHGIGVGSLKNSFVVGDTIRDIKTGKKAGCKTILVFSGKEKAKNRGSWEEAPDFIAKSLKEAAGIILKR